MMSITLKDVNIKRQDKSILKNIDLSLLEGKITTIIGPNGCGKSTLLKTIARIYQPDEGEIYVNDIAMKKLKSKEIAKKIGILSQKNRLNYDIKVHDLVSLSRYPHLNTFQRMSQKDYDIVDWALNETNALEFKGRYMSELSGGQAQRVWISLLLAQQSDIMLLDEPTTYLDIHHQLETLNIVKDLNSRNNKMIVMVLHDINHAIKYSDHIIVMKEGRILTTGSPIEVLTNELLNEVFNIDGQIVVDPMTQKPLLTDYDLFCHSVKGL